MRPLSRFLAVIPLLFLTHCAGPGGYTPYQPQHPAGPFALGIDVLAQDGFPILRGRRVGLITNHTSLTRSGVPTRVVLQRALGPGLTTLFTPEHGLDGREPAGNKITSRRDRLTGLPAYSLYGATRKPTSGMLSGIDVLVFDLQDIGSRSYTYISTMALAMEAAAENGKDFVVLDRPNPLGGTRIQGPPLERRWQSFVGQVPVPYVHGLTTGELARMINGQGWIRSRPRLTVVPMRGWQRWMTWRDTGLRWMPTSPNIPKADSPFYYAATGMLGGLNAVDIGIGTGRPFEYAGGRGVNGREFAAYMNAMRLPGVRFAPYSSSRKPGYAGVQIFLDPRGQTDLCALDVILTYEIVRRTRGAPLAATRGDDRELFHKVYGGERLWRMLQSGATPSGLIAEWRAGNARFASARQPFLLY
jgi:uncharacterized protein YbbC (DUF1343 family)